MTSQICFKKVTEKFSYDTSEITPTLMTQDIFMDAFVLLKD